MTLSSNSTVTPEQIEYMSETVKGNIRTAQLYQRDRRITDGSLEHVIAEALTFLRAVRAGRFDMVKYLELDGQFSEIFERARTEARPYVDSVKLYDQLEALVQIAAGQNGDHDALEKARAWLAQMKPERGTWLNRLDALKQWRDFQDAYRQLSETLK